MKSKNASKTESKPQPQPKLAKASINLNLPIEQAHKIDRQARAQKMAITEYIETLLEPVLENGNLIWVSVAMSKEDWTYARRMWGKDAHAMLDELIGEAIENHRQGR